MKGTGKNLGTHYVLQVPSDALDGSSIVAKKDYDIDTLLAIRLQVRNALRQECDHVGHGRSMRHPALLH